MSQNIISAVTVSNGTRYIIDDVSKSTVSVDNIKADVNMVHISLDDYSDKLVGGQILSNELYVISADYVETYGQQIKNLAPGTELSDAVNFEQLSEVSARAYDTYTKTETDQKIASAQYFKKYVVESLPPLTAADDRGIYLVPSTDSQLSNIYDEYVTVGEGAQKAWEKIGAKNIDLSGYKTKQTAVPSPTASNTTNAFIDTITQNENGEITATKKTVQSASTSQAGIVQLNDSLTSNATNQAATANAVRLTNDKFADYSLTSHVHEQYLTAVPSDYKTYAQTKLSLSGDGYATQDQLNEKSAVSVDNVKADVNMVHISLDDYSEKLVGGQILSNELYVISADYIEAYGQQIKNVAEPTDLSDAATKGYVDNAVQGVQIPTDLSAFTNSPGYLISNDISGYYKKSETSSATELQDAFSTKADISSSLILVEWADLTALADAEELVPGQKYRITDYVTTVDQEDCRSAEHPFDLIVTAIDHTTLDEHAVATLPSNGDTYFDARPFHVPDYQQYLEYARVPLESWDIKYCLDNDKTRFKFADTENGKGVIYYMKDEFGNEAPYDFKNVQFKRYKITSSPGATGLEGMYGLAVGNIEVDTSDEMWCYTFNGADYADLGLSEPYDFSGWHVRPTQAVLQQFGGPSIERLQYCTGNVIQARQEDGDDFSLMSFKLPNNVFHCVLDQTPVSQLPFIKIGLCGANKLGGDCNSNTFGNNCNGNTFSSDCDNNTFDNHCNSNTFGSDCDNNTFSSECNSNTFGSDCDSNTFSDSCYYNTFDNHCNSNTFDNHCNSNTFGSDCDNNTFSSECNSNTFGSDCDNNTFGSDCDNNTFGNNCDSNTFGNNCDSNTFGSDCGYNTFGSDCGYNTFGNSCKYIRFASSSSGQTKSYYKFITIDSGNQYIVLNCTQSTYIENEYKNVSILPGVNNTIIYKTITDSNVNQSFCTTYQSADSQLMTI